MSPSSSFLEMLSLKINSRMESFFATFARLIALHPSKTILLSLAFTLLSLLGYLNFSIVVDPEQLFTPREAICLDDQRWSDWFVKLPVGVPGVGVEQGWELGGRRMAYDTVEGGETGREGKRDLLHYHGFERDAGGHGYDRVSRRGGRELGWGEIGNQTAVPDWELSENNHFIFFKKDVQTDGTGGNGGPSDSGDSSDTPTNISGDPGMVTTATLRSILQFYADLSSEFSSLYQYERSGLGSCWDWDLTTFDVDPNPLSTLTDCFKHDSVQVLFSSHLVRDVNTFKIESADAFFIGVTWSINTFQMQPVDDWYMSYQMSDDTLDKSLICWASINNEIYAALLHDMPYLSLPLIILISYVSFVFYRPDNTSHIPLAYAALANVLMAVFAGLGYMMWMGSPFTALHICAVYITLGVGVDDAFIIAQSIFNEESVNANLGKVERIKRGLGKCGPSLLLTSLTNFCAFMSNASSTVFAIRNFSMVAAMMIIIDYVLQITFFVACCSLDLGRKEKGGGGLCGTKAGEEIAGRKTKTSNAPALSVSVSPSTPTSGRRRSSSADFYNDRFKDDIWSRKLVGTTLPNVILSKWGKVAVLLITAMMMCVGLYGTNYLYISYTPYLLIPKDSYIHEGRAVMHTYFPWVMEESFTCVQLKEFDYSTNQEELKELEDYVCRLASRDQCFAWYSLFRFYVMTKYYGNLEYAMTEDGWVNPDIFYEELAAYGEDETMGGKDVAFQFMRWKSRDELYGSQYCFMWKQDYNVPAEIEWMLNTRKELKEIGTVSDPTVYTGYFFAIEPLSTIVSSTLQNFVLILSVVTLVCLLVLANVKATMLVLTAVMSIEMMVLGSLHFLDLQFNMMSSIMLIVGVGLCVDFSAHTTHAFLHSTERTPHGKARDALRNVGLSIWNGAFSSIAAMMPMGLCKSYMVLTWWRMITLVISLGIWFGLCVVPVMLTLFDDDDGVSYGLVDGEGGAFDMRAVGEEEEEEEEEGEEEELEMVGVVRRGEKEGSRL